VFETEENQFVFRSELGTADHEDFYEMMDHFLVAYESHLGADAKMIRNATFGVAGPTNHQSVCPTNIEGWEINTQTTNAILEDHGHKGFSSIINDFEALGYGVLRLFEAGFTKDEFEPIYGRFRTTPARVGEDIGYRSLVCGPGTGLGVACLVEGLMKDGFPFIFSSEGGHTSMAPETPEQLRFLGDGQTFNGKQSYEHALSHVGLRNIYNFFRKADYNAEPHYSISSKKIVELATDGDQAATDSIELFCELLANFCGNAVLSFNCDRGVFLWGGALRIMPADLITSRFKKYYARRCSHSDRVARVPVVLLTNPEVPLLGCVHRSVFEVEYADPDG